jgi:hypothetical protein
MSMFLAVLAGAVVFWMVAFAPGFFGLLPRGGPLSQTLPTGSDLWQTVAGAAFLSVVYVLMLRLSETASFGGAVLAGVVIGTVPAAFLAGRALREGNTGAAFRRATLFFSATVLSSVTIFAVMA